MDVYGATETAGELDEQLKHLPNALTVLRIATVPRSRLAGHVRDGDVLRSGSHRLPDPTLAAYIAELHDTAHDATGSAESGSPIKVRSCPGGVQGRGPKAWRRQRRGDWRAKHLRACIECGPRGSGRPRQPDRQRGRAVWRTAGNGIEVENLRPVTEPPRGWRTSPPLNDGSERRFRRSRMTCKRSGG